MTRIKKKKILGFLLLFLTFGFFLLQWFAKNYIEDLLSEKLPNHIALKYSDLDINLFSGNAVLHNTSVNIQNEDTLQNHTSLNLKKLQLKGIGYWDLMFNETLSIKNILLETPNINYYPYKKVTSKKLDKDEKKKGLKIIKFNEFNITNGSLNIMKKNEDSIKTSIASYNLKISKSTINLQSNNSAPFTFNSYNLEAKNIILSNNDFETVSIDHLNLEKETSLIENFKITPKYSKQELSYHLEKERDHINLIVPKVVLKNLDFGIKASYIALTIGTAELINPKFEIYRDKLVSDDVTTKSLYSSMLRNLNFELAINKIEIKKGYISYAELVEAGNKAGKLFFDKVDGTISHLTNVKNADKTKINVNSQLMGKAPLELQWSFDVNNENDAFEVSGAISNLPVDDLNPFFKPNLNVLAEGSLQQMYFTFYGNNIESKGEMKMKYDDFKFNILRKNGSKINKVLTAIGNIFVSDDSKTNSDKFRFGTINAERDNTKSFFNYLWINVKSGMISTLTGDGDK